jgi:hypothetical protein
MTTAAKWEEQMELACAPDAFKPKYLGYENGWYKGPPEEYTKCEGHELEHSVTEDCVHTYICRTCNIEWKMDSGD